MLRYYFDADYRAGHRYAMWGKGPEMWDDEPADSERPAGSSTNTKSWLAGYAAGEKRHARKPHGGLSSRKGERIVRELIAQAEARGDDESVTNLRGILHDNEMARQTVRKKSQN